MYVVIHVPTGDQLGVFKTTRHIFKWFAENPDVERTECIAHRYERVETVKFGK